MSDNQEKKDRKWLFFAIGLIVGFLISAVAFVVFAVIQSPSVPFSQTIEHIYSGESTKDTVIKYVTVVRTEPVAAVDEVAAEQQDSTAIAEVPEEYDEVDFSYAETAVAQNEDVVVMDKLLTRRTMKVKFKNADFKDVAAEEGAMSELEVQQWDTPIKNRISYRFTDNILQIKGLDVESVEVIHYEKQYYLSYHGNYYLLAKNNSFEKLGLPVALD